MRIGISENLRGDELELELGRFQVWKTVPPLYLSSKLEVDVKHKIEGSKDKDGGAISGLPFYWPGLKWWRWTR
ncbi:unnamed protein product [Dovyalis caffra]|uniref:Uncharacterized protein n=1 Tax=Dovyalis caffra TaxID=77055 RepID=A0AAV1S7G6_9ROSI|nr:unnamed protein product [Dovyalis caffra]